MPSNNYVDHSSSRDGFFHTSNSPTNIPSLTPASTLDSSVDASPSRYAAGDEVLDDTVFPEFKSNEESNLEEHRKEDPLGVDMWKFYRKQSRLPDAGRMENMTWRMMAINLRKVQQQGHRAPQTPTQRNSDPNRHHSTTPQVPASTNPRPAGAQVRRIAILRGRPRLHHPSASEQPTLDARSFPVPAADDPYQYGYNPDTTPQMPPNATNIAITNSQKQRLPFPSPPPPPPSSGYDFRNGPRGHIQVPPPAPQPEPQPSAHHPRHVSLASEYLPHGDAIDCGFQAPANHHHHHHHHQQRGAAADVAPWDPGWAEEAFGGRPLCGPTARVVKREEDLEESTPSFDAPGHLDGEEWLFGGQGAGVMQQQQHGVGEWQRFGESHYAEMDEHKLFFGGQAGVYGEHFGKQEFGFGGSGVEGGIGYQHHHQQQQQQQSAWGQGSGCVVAGRKRRKGQ